MLPLWRLNIVTSSAKMVRRIYSTLMAVILDIITYRRHGHNEMDNPEFTQPIMYKQIRSRQSVPRQYEDQLTVCFDFVY
jgi:2-oxoglutarate dehydrogenase complex dehydrogenase (E1) component-like enzyme